MTCFTTRVENESMPAGAMGQSRCLSKRMRITTPNLHESILQKGLARAISLLTWIVSFSQCVVKARSPQRLKSLFRRNEFGYLRPNSRFIRREFRADVSIMESGLQDVPFAVPGPSLGPPFTLPTQGPATCQSKTTGPGGGAGPSSDSTGNSRREWAEIGWHTR